MFQYTNSYFYLKFLKKIVKVYVYYKIKQYNFSCMIKIFSSLGIKN